MKSDVERQAISVQPLGNQGSFRCFIMRPLSYSMSVHRAEQCWHVISSGSMSHVHEPDLHIYGRWEPVISMMSLSILLASSSMHLDAFVAGTGQYRKWNVCERVGSITSAVSRDQAGAVQVVIASGLVAAAGACGEQAVSCISIQFYLLRTYLPCLSFGRLKLRHMLATFNTAYWKVATSSTCETYQPCTAWRIQLVKCWLTPFFNVVRCPYSDWPI